MNVRGAALSLCLFGLTPTACALAGYDFDDYQRGRTTNGGSANDPRTTAGSPDGGHGDQLPSGGASPGVGGEASTSAGGRTDHPIGPEPTTFGVGGGPSIEGMRQGEGGDEAGGPGGAGGAGDNACVSVSCSDLAAECGTVDDGCGNELDCGGCFWWFLECRENSCQFTN